MRNIRQTLFSLYCFPSLNCSLALPLERCPAQPFWTQSPHGMCVCLLEKLQKRRIASTEGLRLLEFAGGESQAVCKELQSPPEAGGVGKRVITSSPFSFSSFLFHKAKPKLIPSLTNWTLPHLKSLAKVVLQEGRGGSTAGQPRLVTLSGRDLDIITWMYGSNLSVCLAHLRDWARTQQEK